MDKKDITFFGIIGAVLGLFILLSNPWNFSSIPSLASAIGLFLFFGGLWAVYYANK